MRKLFLAVIVAAVSLSAQSQDREYRPFDSKKFEQQLEEFVVKKAGFTQAEADIFLPVYREMRQKQVELMQGKAPKEKPKTEKDWANLIRERDNAEVKLKNIQQTYHNRMLKVVPASRLALALRAEEEFHREAFRQVHSKRGKGNARRNRGDSQRGGNQRNNSQQ